MSFLCAEYDYEMDMRVNGEESFEDGEEKALELIDKLLQDNRQEDIKLIKNNKKYRSELYAEYNL